MKDLLHAELEADEQFYRDTESIAFPDLDDRQLAMLEPLGSRRIVRRGESVFKAGQRDIGLSVILRGEVEVFESREGQEQILAEFGPRGFIGDVSMLISHRICAKILSHFGEQQILTYGITRTRNATRGGYIDRSPRYDPTFLEQGSDRHQNRGRVTSRIRDNLRCWNLRAH